MVESIGQLTKSSKMVSRESKEDKKMKKYEMKQVMVDPFDIMCGECQQFEIEVWEEVSVEGLQEMHEQFLQNDKWMDEADKQQYEDMNGEPWKPTPETFDEFLAEAIADGYVREVEA